jgi:hypothetical protein
MGLTLILAICGMLGVIGVVAIAVVIFLQDRER